MSNPLYTLATCADRILTQPMIGEPGKVFSYGGNSMQVAGRMAELATGEAWDDLFIAEMVTPLGLNATDFATSSTAPGYVRTDNPRMAGGVRSTRQVLALQWRERWQRHGPLALVSHLCASHAERLLRLHDGERRLTNTLQLGELLQEADARALGMHGLVDCCLLYTSRCV